MSYLKSLRRGSSGFTLVELLVVIAIIAILATIVLARLSTVRDNANVSKVKAQLVAVRTAAEAYYSQNNTYGTAATNNAVTPVTGCGGATSLWIDGTYGIATLVGPNSNWPANTVLYCNSTTTAWAVEARLPDLSFWCVDSVGANKTEAAGTPLAALTACQ